MTFLVQFSDSKLHSQLRKYVVFFCNLSGETPCNKEKKGKEDDQEEEDDKDEEDEKEEEEEEDKEEKRRQERQERGNRKKKNFFNQNENQFTENPDQLPPNFIRFS